MKQQIINILTKIVGRNHFVNINGRCKFDSTSVKSGFASFHGTNDYPIEIMDSSIIGSVSIGEGCKILNSKLSGNAINIGFCTSLNEIAITQFINPITIGNYCSIAAGTRIVETNHKINVLSSYHYHKHILHGSVYDDIYSKGPVVIEDNVWIGCNTVILPGVRIGRGAVVGAGSVVTNSIQPYSICVGNPARVIKMRFKEDTICQIEESKWWLSPPQKLKNNRILFETDITQNYGELLRRLKQS